jgi:hypothetical protein
MEVGRMITDRFGAAAMALSLFLAAPAFAQGNSKGRGENAKGASASQAATVARVGDVEIKIIRDYFAAGKTKLHPLPPGIARNLARGKPLPPGIAKKLPPSDLLRRLPSRSGARWIMAGDVVLLVDVTDVVIDIVRAIL